MLGFSKWDEEIYSRALDHFHCHATIRNRPVEDAKKIKCYKRLAYMHINISSNT